MKLSLLKIFLLLHICVCSAQKNDSVAYYFQKINTAYHNKKITETAYLSKVTQLSYDLLAKGIHIKTTVLRDYLSPFEQIAFSDKKYEKYRIQYYTMLLNNSAMFDKRGAAMYFAEKIGHEYKLQNQYSLVEAAEKCRIFITRKNYEKVIETYNKEKAFINNIPYLLEKNRIEPRIALDAFHILEPASAVFCEFQDNKSLSEIYDVSVDIVSALKKKNLPPNYLLQMELQLLEQEFFKSNINKDYKAVDAVFKKIHLLKEKYKNLTNTYYIESALIEWKTDFYTRTRQTDSAELYIEKYKSIAPLVNNDVKERLLLCAAEIDYAKGKYKDAYLHMEKANVISDSIKTQLTGELDDLLYSFTKAEDMKNALEQAESTKHRQRIQFFSICVLFLLIISGIIWARIRKNKIIQNRIDRLNSIANIQIATMEEKAFQAVKNEQIRLGEDLHNSAASSLSAIKHQIELLLLEDRTNDKAQLTRILKQVEHVYEFTRHKSHEWYSLSDKKAEALFYQQIHTNLEMIFPSHRYNKTIEIDQDVLEDITSVQKIELLKVIQEALANIIKHSKARNISLLLYRENDHSVSLFIKNDGNFTIKKNNGLGIKSVISRISNMGGTVKIDTDDGFGILINLPLA